MARGAAATTFPVSNLFDSGPGSLRQAVLAANASAGADEITFAPGLGGTITLTSGEILISDALAVTGPGAGALTVSGNNASRIFHIENSTDAAPIDVTLSGLTLTRGHSEETGGAVAAFGENLTILESVISDSSALQGGNLWASQGRFILKRSTISNGSAGLSPPTGGLFLHLPAENSLILHSTISGNSGTGLSSQGAVTVEASTISGNTGSGMFAGDPDGGGVPIVNSTISGNEGVGISLGDYYFGGVLLLRQSTVAYNKKGGIFIVSIAPILASAELDHAIVSKNGGSSNCNLDGYVLPPSPFGGDVSFRSRYSLIGANCGAAVVSDLDNTTLFGADPRLGPLADNGGPTLTHALLPGSAAIDAGDPAIPSPPATDQRGLPRIVGPAVDMGAFERQPQPVLIEVPALSQVGILTLSLLLLALGIRRLR